MNEPQIQPSDGQKSLKDMPLDAETAERLGAIGARLHEHLGAVIECLPKEDRTAKGMTTRFRVEGVVARRLVRALAGTPGLVTLTRLPSPEHVRNFVNLLEFEGVHKEACVSVKEALDDLATAAQGVGGGRARLTKRIRMTIRDDDG